MPAAIAGATHSPRATWTTTSTVTAVQSRAPMARMLLRDISSTPCWQDLVFPFPMTAVPPAIAGATCLNRIR
jgi:hypothetical protein